MLIFCDGSLSLYLTTIYGFDFERFSNVFGAPTLLWSPWHGVHAIYPIAVDNEPARGDSCLFNLAVRFSQPA